MNNVNYTESFRINAVEQLLKPGSLNLTDTAEKLGVPVSTLYGWKAKYANIATMDKTKKIKKVNEYTPEQKMEIINKSSSMSEEELGNYLRSEGLHLADIKTFKEEFLSSIKTKGRPKLDPELVTLRKEHKILKRDHKKTQSALAEQSARIILLKKSHEIWGVKEDDE